MVAASNIKRVHERLGNVASQLALADIELLGEQPRRAAGGTVALEPPDRLSSPALLVSGQGHQEPAEHKGTLGVFEGPLILAEPVDIAGATEVCLHCFEGGQAPGISGRHGPADGGQQQGGIDPGVAGGSLPAPTRVQTVRAHVGHDRIGECCPRPGPGARPARRPRSPGGRPRT